LVKSADAAKILKIGKSMMCQMMQCGELQGVRWVDQEGLEQEIWKNLLKIIQDKVRIHSNGKEI